MIGVDTNILVRYLIQDDPVQAKKAAQCIEKAADADDPILLGNIVLCETVWVLDSAYGYSKAEIADTIDKLLQAAAFRFEDKDAVRVALNDYRNSKADFADSLIGQIHRKAGCQTTFTFDSALRGLSTFRLLQ